MKKILIEANFEKDKAIDKLSALSCPFFNLKGKQEERDEWRNKYKWYGN